MPRPLVIRMRPLLPLWMRPLLPLWMRPLLVLGLILGASLLGAAAAQATVVDLNPALAGSSGAPQTVSFPADESDYAGVSLMPGTSAPDAALSAAHVPIVNATSSCTDPWLTFDLGGPYLPTGSLCYQGGQVLHANETIDLTWDPLRRYWQDTKEYMEQFLRNVADASGSLGSPFALTTQYHDGGGQAGNESKYGGGCIDFGNPGGYTCTLGDTTGSGTGNDYPNGGVGDCSSDVSGISAPFMEPDGSIGSVTNRVCLTNADIRAEVASIVSRTSFERLHQPGYTPLVDVLLPAGVEVCLDSTGSLCSANSDAKSVAAQFCSYHSWTSVDGVQIPYVVQPWTTYTACDESGISGAPSAEWVGENLVGPLSQSQIAALVNPYLNGWFADANNVFDDVGAEIDRCPPLGYGPPPLDNVSINGQTYALPREFNNAGLIQNDPNSPGCAHGVVLNAQFVLPSPIDQGDVVSFDGSKTDSTLIVPKDDYQWSFGDGTSATGPSVTHVYSQAGTYTVTLHVTDRGGNRASLSQTVTALGAGGQAPGGGSRPGSGTQLQAHLLLLPQSLRAMLRRGISLLVSSNTRADGILSLSIPRAAARRAGLRTGRALNVSIGRGTVAGLKDGVVTLHLRVPARVAKKLGRLRSVTVTVRLLLLAPGAKHLALDVAGRY